MMDKPPKKGYVRNPKFLYDRINLNTWEIMENIHAEMGYKHPDKINTRNLADTLDWRDDKVRNILTKLKNKKMITNKKMHLTSYGKRVKKSFEKKYDVGY